jgi:hypothetical protein
MDSAYMHYCFADPGFYDLVESRDDGRSRFAVLHLSAVGLPPQGWKIHISGTGRDIGQYALACLRLRMLLPLTGALDRPTRVPPTISHASPHRVRKGGDIMEFVLQLQELEVSTENPAMNGGGYDSHASLLICE